jgi:BA14K-like protein
MTGLRSRLPDRATAALLIGVLALAAWTAAAADAGVRGLIVNNGRVQFNGIAIESRAPQNPVQNGGHPLHQRSSSPQILSGPGAERKVLLELSSRYDLPVAHLGWCTGAYRSYRASDNTFQPYQGPRRQCDSPYP